MICITKLSLKKNLFFKGSSIMMRRTVYFILDISVDTRCNYSSFNYKMILCTELLCNFGHKEKNVSISQNIKTKHSTSSQYIKGSLWCIKYKKHMIKGRRLPWQFLSKVWWCIQPDNIKVALRHFLNFAHTLEVSFMFEKLFLPFVLCLSYLVGDS